MFLKKKILLVVPSLRIGGGEKLVLDMALNLDKEKYDVFILCFFAPVGTHFEKSAKDSNISVIYLDKKPGFDFRIIFKARKIIKDISPDILSTHLGVLPYLLFIKVKCKKYHTVHNIAQEEARGIRKIFHTIAFKIDNFIPVAICDTVQQSIAAYYNISLSKIPRINNGIDTTIFSYKGLKKTDNDVRIITTGGLRPVKNHLLMVEAFKIYLDKYPNSELVICGEGKMRNDIENRIEEYGLDDKVILKGNVKNIAEELNNSDIYFMTSDYEGLSLAIAEAMSCGLPVVTTASGGTIDIVKDGINGLVSGIGDAQALADNLFKLAINKDLRKQMSENSLILVKNFDIKKTVKQYELLFEGKKL